MTPFVRGVGPAQGAAYDAARHSDQERVREDASCKSKYIGIYVYVYMCICVNIYIYIYVLTHMYITCVHLSLSIYIYIYACWFL